MKNDHALHAFNVTIFLINFRPDLLLFCHNLQTTRLESLKLSILALKYRKPINKIFVNWL